MESVLDGGLDNLPGAELAGQIKLLNPAMPMIAIAAAGFIECPNADYQLESFDSAKLLETHKAIKPKEYAEIEKRNENLTGTERTVDAIDLKKPHPSCSFAKGEAFLGVCLLARL